jgi:hypothetical protein
VTGNPILAVISSDRILPLLRANSPPSGTGHTRVPGTKFAGDAISDAFTKNIFPGKSSEMVFVWVGKNLHFLRLKNEQYSYKVRTPIITVIILRNFFIFLTEVLLD